MGDDNISITTGESYVDYANSTLTFPQKLFILMEKEAGDIIQWATHGLCFRIIDEDTFVDALMPKYFKRKPQNTSLRVYADPTYFTYYTYMLHQRPSSPASSANSICTAFAV